MSTPGTYPPLPTPPPPAATKRPNYVRRHAPWFVGAAIIAAFLIGLGAGQSSGSKTTTAAAVPAPATSAPAAPAATTPAAAPAPAAPAAVTIAGDGTYLVGSDVQPGTYKSPGGDGRPCYWARLKDASGNAIIANNFADGPSVVTIAKTDAAFETSGCQTWTKVK